jgi:protein SCO1/2
LQKITQVLKQMDEAQAEKITPLFITVDPERDTAQVMREYVDLFHPRLIGLTGTPDQIEQVKVGYKVFAAKVPTEDGSDYTMDHSSFIYLIGPEGTALAIYRMQDDAAMIGDDVAQILTRS